MYNACIVLAYTSFTSIINMLLTPMDNLHVWKETAIHTCMGVFLVNDTYIQTCINRARVCIE